MSAAMAIAPALEEWESKAVLGFVCAWKYRAVSVKVLLPLDGCCRMKCSSKTPNCDNCIIGTTVALQYLSCIISCVAMFVNNDGLREAAYILDLIADLLWVSMCACMQSQHHVQLKARDANRAQWVVPPHPMMAPLQQAMGIPAYGIPPPISQQQGQYQQGAYGYPPPQQQGGYGAYPPPPQQYPPPTKY